MSQAGNPWDLKNSNPLISAELHESIMKGLEPFRLALKMHEKVDPTICHVLEELIRLSTSCLLYKWNEENPRWYLKTIVKGIFEELE